MHLFLDTEFNGFGGELISLALIGEDGREWYEELPLPAAVHPWVAANVVPKLTKAPLRPDAFRASLLAFLKACERPVIVADWYTDFAILFGIMAGEDHSTSANIPCQTILLGMGPPEDTNPNPHNALDDARHLREWYLAGATVERVRHIEAA